MSAVTLVWQIVIHYTSFWVIQNVAIGTSCIFQAFLILLILKNMTTCSYGIRNWFIPVNSEMHSAQRHGLLLIMTIPLSIRKSNGDRQQSSGIHDSYTNPGALLPSSGYRAHSANLTGDTCHPLGNLRAHTFSFHIVHVQYQNAIILRMAIGLFQGQSNSVSCRQTNCLDFS